MKIETKYSIGDVVRKPSGFLSIVHEIDVTVYSDGSKRITYHLTSEDSYNERSLEKAVKDGYYYCDNGLSGDRFATINGTDDWEEAHAS